MGLFDKLKQQKEAQEAKPAESVLDELRRIGDAAGVNPPADDVEAAPDPVVVEHEAEPEPSPAPEKKTGPGGVCPTCGKEFRHLSRHKCKGKPLEASASMMAMHDAVVPVDPKTGVPVFDNENKLPGADPSAPPKDTKPPTGEHFRRGPDWKFKRGDQAWLDQPVKVLSSWGTDEDRKYHVELKPSCGTAEQIKPINFDVYEAELWSNEDLDKAKDPSAALTHKEVVEREYKKSESETEQSLDSTLVFDLFLDCEIITNDLEWQYLADYLSDIEEAICKEQNIEHWKCCEYGKGPGLLAVRLERKLLQDTEIGVIVCDTRTAEFSACSGVLRKYARNIVIGVR